MNTVGKFSLLILVCAIVAACKHDIPDVPTTGTIDTTEVASQVCSPDTVYFQQAVLPILVSNCAVSGCHDATTREKGYVFNDYQNIMKVVRPGNARQSELYEVITDSDPDDRMPYKRAPLTSAQIATIEKWINQGAKNNRCSEACDTSSFTFAAKIRPIFQTNCVGCHSGASASGGIDFTTYEGIRNMAQNGRLWGAINHHAGFSPMPKGGRKLSDCDISLIGGWIRSGTPNN